MATVYDFTVRDIDGQDVRLDRFKDEVLLIVNTASKCTFTPQYEGLEALYAEYGQRGLKVLGFPCNQFANQEPGSESEIASFCQVNYGVTFPVFAKIDVNGPHASPLFQWLATEAPGLLGSKIIKWNFTKFLVDRHGAVVKRFAPATQPKAIKVEIEKLLPHRF